MKDVMCDDWCGLKQAISKKQETGTVVVTLQRLTVIL